MNTVFIYLLFHWTSFGRLEVPMAYINNAQCMQAAQKVIDKNPKDIAYCIPASIPHYANVGKKK